MKTTVLLILALLLGGCATTGNPREGGLIGWSRSKADARAATLESQEASERRHADFARRRGDELGERKTGLGDEAEQLHAQLDRMMDENASLDAHLRDLMRRHRLDGAEAARLQAMLDEAKALRDAPPPPARDEAKAAARVDAVNNQNERLHREVMALIKR